MMLVLVCLGLSMHALQVENKVLHSSKAPLELGLEEAVATGDTDAFPTVAINANPLSPSTSWKVGMSELDQDQAETEVATSRVELKRQDTSAEKDALVMSEGTIKDDPHIKAQSLENKQLHSVNTSLELNASQVITWEGVKGMNQFITRAWRGNKLCDTIKERENERMNEGTKERTNEGTNERTSTRIGSGSG
jgi:hypothetical protein